MFRLSGKPKVKHFESVPTAHTQNVVPNMQKMKISILTLLFSSIVLLGFKGGGKISKCLIDYDSFQGLKVTAVDKLPNSAPKFRDLKTKEGEKRVSRVDGYRILYDNEFGAQFINLKIEQSDPKRYQEDSTTLIQSLDYLLSVSQFMDSDKLHEFTVNGYKIFGFNRNTLEKGSTLATYVMFPGNNTTVHFYFNNLIPKARHIKTINEYYKIRDQFFDEYTAHITDCKN